MAIIYSKSSLDWNDQLAAWNALWSKLSHSLLQDGYHIFIRCVFCNQNQQGVERSVINALLQKKERERSFSIVWQGRKILMTVIPSDASSGNWKEQWGLCTDFSQTLTAPEQWGLWTSRRMVVLRGEVSVLCKHRLGIRITLHIPSHALESFQATEWLHCTHSVPSSSRLKVLSPCPAGVLSGPCQVPTMGSAVFWIGTYQNFIITRKQPWQTENLKILVQPGPNYGDIVVSSSFWIVRTIWIHKFRISLNKLSSSHPGTNYNHFARVLPLHPTNVLFAWKATLETLRFLTNPGFLFSMHRFKMLRRLRYPEVYLCGNNAIVCRVSQGL